MLLRRPLLLAAAFLAAAATARAEIEFIGVLVMPGRSLFALSDDPAKPAAWRALGQDFADYRLTEFDAKADTLVLTKNGATLRVHLKDDAKVKSARLELGGTITTGQGEKLEVTRVTLIFDQETVLPLKDGLTWHITPTLRPDGNIRYRLAIERTIQSGDLKKVQQVSAPNIIARPHDSFKIAVGDLQFEFAPTNP